MWLTFGVTAETLFLFWGVLFFCWTSAGSCFLKERIIAWIFFNKIRHMNCGILGKLLWNDPFMNLLPEHLHLSFVFFTCKTAFLRISSLEKASNSSFEVWYLGHNKMRRLSLAPLKSAGSAICRLDIEREAFLCCAYLLVHGRISNVFFSFIDELCEGPQLAHLSQNNKEISLN